MSLSWLLKRHKPLRFLSESLLERLFFSLPTSANIPSEEPLRVCTHVRVDVHGYGTER